MSTKLILLLCANLIILTVCIRLIFKTFRGFLKGIWYFLKPNIVSLLQKDWDNDFNYTHRLLLVGVIMFVVVMIEFIVFY